LSLGVQERGQSDTSSIVLERTRYQKVVLLLRKNAVSDLGLAIILIVILVAIFAQVVAPYKPNAQPFERLLPPSLTNPLGTDQYGRDLLSRVIFGARISLYVGMISVGMALIGGLILGLAAGYFGGKIDDIVMSVMDIMFAVPFIVLAIVIVGVLGPSLTNAMIAIGIAYTPRFARLVRGPVLAVMEEEYILACRAMGARDLRIMFRHVLPNVLSPVIIQATLELSSAILSEAALSFLGLGAQPPTPSWGSMLQEGRRYMTKAPWAAFFPGLAITITVLGFNLLGDGLRDMLDPRLRNE